MESTGPPSLLWRIYWTLRQWTIMLTFRPWLKCENGCGWTWPYGFVPMADCPVHDRYPMAE
ncbi:MAG: hypothetical protein ACYSUV_21450 [Planctomycetota bacterium]|jgi:hypothetical protein